MMKGNRACLPGPKLVTPASDTSQPDHLFQNATSSQRKNKQNMPEVSSERVLEPPSNLLNGSVVSTTGRKDNPKDFPEIQLFQKPQKGANSNTNSIFSVLEEVRNLNLGHNAEEKEQPPTEEDVEVERVEEGRESTCLSEGGEEAVEDSERSPNTVQTCCPSPTDI